MKQGKTKLIFFIILATAFLLRAFPVDWDGGYYTHPDEAHIYNVVFQLDMPSNLEEFLTPESPLNPKFFAYGSFPLYLLKGAAGLFGLLNPELTHYGNLYKIGRPLSAFFDTLTVLLLFVLARKLFGSIRLALVSIGLYALTVFAIQNSHFYIVDTQLTFWSIATITSLTFAYLNKTAKFLLLANIAAGFAMATKFTGVTLAPLVLLAAALFPFHTRTNNETVPKTLMRSTGYSIAAASLVTLLAIGLQPYVIIDFATFKESLALQLTMSKDATVFPYTIQYLNTTPYLYPLTQITNWGIGPTLGIAAIIGFLAITVRTFREMFNKKITPLLFVTIFVWGAFLSVGGSAVKFMRYFLPLYPFLILGAALVLIQLTKLKQHTVGLLLIGIIVVPSLWWTGAFLSIYRTEHPWVTASHWMHDHIPAGTHLAVEHWDRSLPLYSAHRFPTTDLALYEIDSLEKITQLVDTLYDSSYVVIASNRIYDAVPKLPARYPATIKYYDFLFAEQLGFIKIAEFDSYPTFLGVTRADQKADESFTVYDHPRVQIFKKEAFNREAVAQMLYNSL